MKQLRGTNAIVTGASRGLGVSIAAALAARGVNLTLAARSAADLDGVRDEVSSSGVQVVSIPTDVSDAAQCEALVAKAEDAIGPTDILVNNAGIERASAFADLALDDIASIVDVNLKASLLLARLVLPGMLERGRGHIVNISSLAGKGGFPYETPYSATKAGLVMFTHTLREELSGSPVSASVVCPGFVADDGMYARMAEDGHRAPMALLPTTPRKVADAVVKAIVRDAPELIVNRTPMRPVLALSQAFPAATTWIYRLFGVTRYGRAVASARRP